VSGFSIGKGLFTLLRKKGYNMKKILLGILLASTSVVAPLTANAEISVSINIAPPELPVYEQPAIPGDGYIWTPGYWAWSPDDQDYYWVPGTWVQAPYVGALWTPGYWGWVGGNYAWHQGYWGDHVGFYGGVNYGFGYVGTGYLGGHWDHGGFAYNTAVTNVTNVHVTNVYNTVVPNNNATHVSFNGGNGGVRAQPSQSEQSFARAQHTGPLPSQVQNEQVAHRTPELRASVNHGTPPVAATPTPGKFNAPAPNNGPEKGSAIQAAPHSGTNMNPGENAQHPAPPPQPHPEAQPPRQPQQQQQPAPQRPTPQQPPQPQVQPRPQPMPHPEQPPHPQPQEMHQPQPQPQPHQTPQEPHPEQHQQPPHREPPQQGEQDKHHD
jgi:hypothetical protein